MPCKDIYKNFRGDPNNYPSEGPATVFDAKINAKFVVQKLVKNRIVEGQRVAKATSTIERLEVSVAQSSPYR